MLVAWNNETKRIIMLSSFTTSLKCQSNSFANNGTDLKEQLHVACHLGLPLAIINLLHVWSNYKCDQILDCNILISLKTFKIRIYNAAQATIANTSIVLHGLVTFESRMCSPLKMWDDSMSRSKIIIIKRWRPETKSLNQAFWKICTVHIAHWQANNSKAYYLCKTGSY